MVADFDNNGAADIAVTDLADNTIRVLLNRGAGSGSSRSPYPGSLRALALRLHGGHLTHDVAET